MSNYLMEDHEEEEENQYQLAFGEHTDISQQYRNDVITIRNNDANTTEFILDYRDADNLSNLGWELLGRYIANNTHVREVDLQDCRITDAKMTLLFSRLRQSASLEIINFCHNSIGAEGVKSMLPFLENTPNLSGLYLNDNRNIDTEGFDMLMSALNGSSSMEELWFCECGIEDISAMNTCTLPNLRIIDLSLNDIGRDGCISISNLLQSEASTLTELYLDSTGVGDDEAEILASSLKHNTKLIRLDLELNNIGERGKGAFLKLLNDISSIESTFNSNHTLKKIMFSPEESGNVNLVEEWLGIACDENNDSSSPAAAGRAKVIRTQLNNQNRKMLCQLQRMNENEPSNILAGIEPVALLPKILALIGMHHDESSFYTVLVPLAPDLLSFIDRKALLKDTMAKNATAITDLAAEHARQVAALNAKFTRQKNVLTARGSEFERRLTCMETKVGSQSHTMGENKRQRKC